MWLIGGAVVAQGHLISAANNSAPNGKETQADETSIQWRCLRNAELQKEE
jgi:hypothetical protein